MYGLRFNRFPELKEDSTVMAQKSAHEIDMLHGAIFPQYIRFCLPLALSIMLQLLFNAADVIVVGRFAGADALAAVGSTTSLITLLINFFGGLSTGINIMVSREYASSRYEEVSKIVHTAILTALFGGILCGAAGAAMTDTILLWMKSPDNIRGLSAVYLHIYYAGLPAVILYNYGAAVMRSVGDTRRPMLYLLFSGIVNAVLNLILVIYFQMGVAGVGIATTVSNYLSMLLVIRALLKEDSCLKLRLSALKPNRKILQKSLTLGLPIGLQNSLFSIANVMIQSSVNSLGSIYMAGNAAASSVVGFQEAFNSANMSAVLSFVSQNVGARKYARTRKIFISMTLYGVVIVQLICLVFILARRPLLSLYNTNPDVIEVGARRMVIVMAPAFLAIIIDACSSLQRGYGHTVEPMITSLLGACGFRIIWLAVVFRHFPLYEVIIAAWPISWFVTMIGHFFVIRKMLRQYPREDLE